jgi:hypothetical protein
MPGDYILPGGKTILDRDVVLSPASVAANTTAEQLFTVAGARAGDIVTVSKPSAQAGIGIVGARVSAPDQVGITFGNWTGGGITPTAAETYLIRLGRG